MDDALSFEVLDAAGTRGAYFGKRPGALAPLLEWDLKSLEVDSKFSDSPNSENH